MVGEPREDYNVEEDADEDPEEDPIEEDHLEEDPEEDPIEGGDPIEDPEGDSEVSEGQLMGSEDLWGSRKTKTGTTLYRTSKLVARQTRRRR